MVSAPDQYEVPDDFIIRYDNPLKGKIIFIKRTENKGFANVLGNSWEVDHLWANKLIHAEIILKKQRINFYRLRRREPNDQTLINSQKFSLK
jgi:hypothetical protein